MVATHLGYLSFLSGNFGYTYGTSLWDAKDTDFPPGKPFAAPRICNTSMISS